MLKIALRMLIKNAAKYRVIILGISFASFIITQQTGTFISILTRTYNIVSDIPEADIWITDPHLIYLNDAIPLKSVHLEQMRSLKEVRWAMPLTREFGEIILPNGSYQNSLMLGIDNATLIGAPPEMIEGKIEDLKTPDAVIISKIGLRTRLKINDVITINKRRAKIVGFCKPSRTLFTVPVVYTLYDSSFYSYINPKLPSLIIIKTKKNVDKQKLCNKIKTQYDLNAYTKKQFKYFIVYYFLFRTGMFLNYAFAVLLGFIIGIAIAGKNFYDFILENLRYLAIFKAMGAGNNILTKMTLVQVLWAGLISWAFGTGFAAIIGFFMRNTDLSFKLPWQLYIFSIFATIFICLVTAFFSLRKVFKIEPASIFYA